MPKRVEKKIPIYKANLDRCKEKNIEPIKMLRNTIHFIVAVDMLIVEHHSKITHNLEEVLFEIIDEYKNYTINCLINDDKKKNINISITKTQENSYNKINRENKVQIINELISIAVNNEDYFVINSEKLSKEYRDDIINEFALKFFIDIHYREDIPNNIKSILVLTYINFIESTISKLKYEKTKNLVNFNHLSELLKYYFSQYDIDPSELLKNHLYIDSLIKGFEQLFFVVVTIHNYKVNEVDSEEFRKIYRKYSKYKSNLKKFIKEEMKKKLKNKLLIF